MPRAACPARRSIACSPASRTTAAIADGPTPAAGSPWPPAPSATPRTATSSSAACARRWASTSALSPATRRHALPSSVPRRAATPDRHPGGGHRWGQHRVRGGRGGLRPHLPRVHASGLGAPDRAPSALRSPDGRELAALAAAAGDIITAGVPEHVRTDTDTGMAVAGTATQLASVDQQLERYERGKLHGYRLTLDACERILARLAAVTVAERRAVPGLDPDRAPTIVAGATIMVESMRLVRARPRGGQRGRHPPRGGHRSNGSTLTPFRTKAQTHVLQTSLGSWAIVANTGSWGRLARSNSCGCSSGLGS